MMDNLRKQKVSENRNVLYPIVDTVILCDLTRVFR